MQFKKGKYPKLNEAYSALIIVCCLVAKSCLTHCDPMDYSPAGSAVHGISQARIVEWIAISFSNSALITYIKNIYNI